MGVSQGILGPWIEVVPMLALRAVALGSRSAAIAISKIVSRFWLRRLLL